VSGAGFGGAGFGNVDDVFEHFGSIFFILCRISTAIVT
jgi:hypothetical protein